MGQTMRVEKDIFRVRNNSIKVGYIHTDSRGYLSARFDNIPTSKGNVVIIEQKPNSCHIDPEGMGMNKLRELGVSGAEGQTVVKDINKIIDDVDWSIDWWNKVRPQCWMYIFVLLHVIGLIIIICIVNKKVKQVALKRNELMSKAQEYAREYNRNSTEFDVRIPQQFTEYIEFIVKPQNKMYDLQAGQYDVNGVMSQQAQPNIGMMPQQQNLELMNYKYNKIAGLQQQQGAFSGPEKVAIQFNQPQQ